MLTTPVVLILFNRPDLTAETFAAIRKAQPLNLLVVGDGPRPQRHGEAELVRQTRQVVADGVDWECQVRTNYSEVNLGCGRRVSSGLAWAFEHHEEIIVLEDDCLPSSDFFRFCETMLERYRHDERVMHVGGTNVRVPKWTHDSAFFTRYPSIWGWASWRRAWKHYDFEMKEWPAFRDGGYLEMLAESEEEARSWRRRFDAVHDGRNDTWDYQWTFACWRRRGLAAMPTHNLVTNLGFREDATHTTSARPTTAMPTEALGPLNLPQFVVADRRADRFIADYVFGGIASRGWLGRLRYWRWKHRVGRHGRAERVPAAPKA